MRKTSAVTVKKKEDEKTPMRTIGVRMPDDIIERTEKIQSRYSRLRPADVMRIIFEHGLESIEALGYLPITNDEPGGKRRPLG